MNSKVKKIYFRLDAGGLIGFGHLGRSEAIADAFLNNGVEPVFIIRKRPSLKNHKFKHKVIFLDEVEDVRSSNTRNWINLDEKIEAEEALRILKEDDLVFIDHYGLGTEFKKKLHKNFIKTIGIFDICPNEVSDQFLINYNPICQKEVEYYKSLSIDTVFLLGISFVPLKFGKRNNIKLINPKKDSFKIGIYLGGVSRELLVKFYGVISKTPCEFTYEWIINNTEDRNYIIESNQSEKIKIIGQVEDVVNFYIRNDLAIGSCGVSFYERAYLGIPQLLVSVADNQYEICKKVVDNDLGYFLGDLRKSNEDGLIEKLSNIDFDKLSYYQRKSYSMIDGNGAEKIAKNILRMI